MSGQILTNELNTIIYDAKKKNPELRSAAEKALQELKALPSTSESQLAADLQRRPQFITPFLIACKSRNAKFALPAVTSLHRLAVAKGLSRDRLIEVLDGLQEASGTGLDVQLKILQCLTSFLQNYSDDLEGDLQFKTLRICITLQQVKAAAVSRTASATLQQIVSSIFEKVEHEDEQEQKASAIARLSLGDVETPVRTAAYDAYRIFDDICILTEGEKPQYLLDAKIQQNFGMELIESVLTNHKEVFDSHKEQAHILRHRIMPLVTRLISERLNFPTTVRSVRLLCILLREYLAVVKSECEIPLSLLNHTLESETSNTWRRALCMETFRIIYSSANLPVVLFQLFDENPSSKNVIQENLASFVRLSAEKPALIGLGQQSSIPVGPEATKSQEPAVLEAGGVAGIISGEVGVSEATAPGISSQWSSMKTPCLDQLDKPEPTQIPDTYAYSLVLTCVNNLSEVLAKVVLPLTAQHGSKYEEVSKQPLSTATNDESSPSANGNTEKSQSSGKRHRARSTMADPLKNDGHPGHGAVVTASKLVNECWPAIMATCSTFLYAALDADYYRNLVRSFQKFTQIAGILRLNTPRDAFLTTLAKAAIPPNIVRGEPTALTPQTPGLLSPGTALRSPSISSDSMWGQGVADSAAQSQRNSDGGSFALTQRNLMCLRALINLAIALGPIMEQGWPIVLNHLESADLVLKSSSSGNMSRDYRPGSQHSQNAEASSNQGTLSSEVAAVEAAITRLMKSTSDWPNSAFISLLQAFCTLIGGDEVSKAASPLRARFQHQRRISSMSGSMNLPSTDSMHSLFAITKVGELAQINLQRLAAEGEDAGWALIQETMLYLAASSGDDSAVRLMAADIIGSIAVETAISTTEEAENIRRQIQQRSVLSLKKEIEILYQREHLPTEAAAATNVEIHRSALEALRAIIEQCGDSLVPGWETILGVVDSVFNIPGSENSSKEQDTSPSDRSLQLKTHAIIPAKLIRSSFGSIQLICSDFLAARSSSTMVLVINILSRFAFQTMDLNIALTAITLFWRVSDFLQEKAQELSFDSDSPNLEGAQETVADLTELANKGSFTAPWFLLQHRLVSMVTDLRADVRNGATHTIFRILDNCSEQMSPAMWDLYLRAITLRMTHLSYDMQESLRSNLAQTRAEDVQALNGSTKLIIDSLSQAICDNFDLITHLNNYPKIWDATLDIYSKFLDFESNELSTAIFQALSKILSQIDIKQQVHSQMTASIVSLWLSSLPAPTQDATASLGEKAGSESSLVAYAETLKQLHRLLQDRMEKSQVETICHNLQRCLLLGKPESYTSDVDRMTALQTQVLECFDMIKRHADKAASTIVNHVAYFTTLPYEDVESQQGQRLTYVAFAKRTCDLLKDLVQNLPSFNDIVESDTFVVALRSLAHSIGLKYEFRKQGVNPALWQKSTSSALAILGNYVAAAPKINEDTKQQIWNEITGIARGILEVDVTAVASNDLLLEDETFDVDAAKSLMTIVNGNTERLIPANISPTSYIETIYRASVIHTLTPDEIPKDIGKPQGLLFGPIRFGRTYDPPFNPRLRMCYVCIDELFSLVAQNDDQSSKTILAREAFPYLMHRCASPLKTYIADQPLRGRMPTPMSQRLELIHILTKLRDLRCHVDVVTEDIAAKGAVHVENPKKRHLEVLAPMLNRAVSEASADKQLAEEMRSVLAVTFS